MPGGTSEGPAPLRRGGLMTSRALLRWLNANHYVSFTEDDTYVDEVMRR